MNLCVFTSGEDVGLLAESCRRVGIELQTFPCPWSTYVAIKVYAAKRFLEKRSEPFAMWVDGHDSLILKGEEVILERFCMFHTPVVIAAERNCWPDEEQVHRYPEVERGPRYLNAGGWIGDRSILIKTLEAVADYAKGDGDDQRAWTRAFLDHAIDTSIDHRRLLFASQCDDDDDLENADPCVRHWNGRFPGRQKFWEELTR